MKTMDKNTAIHSSQHTFAVIDSLLLPILATMALAVTLISIIGFAHPEVIHNAAHDLRHSMIFPCH